MQLEIKFLYSLLYLDTITFSQSGSIKRTSSESSEATDIVTLLGLSGGSEQRKKNTVILEFTTPSPPLLNLRNLISFWTNLAWWCLFRNLLLPIFESPFFICSSKCFLQSHSWKSLSFSWRRHEWLLPCSRLLIVTLRSLPEKVGNRKAVIFLI